MDDLQEPQNILDEEREFREQQRTGIGATDTPKILGLSRYGTARTVYDRLRTDPADAPPPSSLPAWVGMRFQGAVAELYVISTGYRVRSALKHYRDKNEDWLVCHLDYRVWGQPFILVECKTRSRTEGWGPDGSQVVPRDVWAQVQHEMMVTGAQQCHVAVLFGHHTFRVFPIQRHDDFIVALRRILRDFWHDNHLKNVPPALTGHELDAAALEREHPNSGPFYRSATPSQIEVIHALRDAQGAASIAGVALELAKNRVKDLIGGDLGLTGAFGKVTWRRSKDRQEVKHEAVAAEYREMCARSGFTERQLSDVVAAHSKTVKGTRRFTVDWEE